MMEGVGFQLASFEAELDPEAAQALLAPRARSEGSGIKDRGDN